MMKINHISYSFVLYLALVEGLALLVLDKFPNYGGFFVGLIPALIVLIIYKIKQNYLPVKINNKEIKNVPIVFPSIFNGAFIVILFTIQSFMPVLPSVLSEALFGFASVLISVLLMILIYNIFSKRKASYLFALYAGLFEFFILPLMFVFYQLNLHVFINGFAAGLIGGTIGLFITNKILKKKSLVV